MSTFLLLFFLNVQKAEFPFVFLFFALEKVQEKSFDFLKFSVSKRIFFYANNMKYAYAIQTKKIKNIF